MTCWLTIIGTSIILLWIGTIADARPGANDGQNLPTDDPSMHVGDGQPATESTNQELGSEQKNVCLNDECKHIASKLSARMNRTVKPCDDFYEFVCGNFVNSTEIPNDKVYVNNIALVTEQVQDQLKTIMDANITETELKPFKLVKTLYKTCMDHANIEARGVKPLRDIMDKNGGWPVLEGTSWNETAFLWRNLTYKLRETGHAINYFGDFEVKPDPKNNTRRVIQIDQATLGIPQEFLIKGFNDPIVQAYYTYMVGVAELMGAKTDHAQNELRDALLFEIDLAKINSPAMERRDLNSFYNPTTVKKLIENHPLVPWKDHFTRLIISPGIDINNDTIVIIKALGYIEKLENLMSTTPKRIQANYAMWRIAADSANFLNDAIRTKALTFTAGFDGRTERPDRWIECVYTVTKNLGLSVGAMYVDRYFNADKKSHVADMITNIMGQLRLKLEEVDWLDNMTRQAALEKVSEMSSTVAYPDELEKDDKLVDHYQNLELSEDNYLENILAIKLFDMNHEFGKLNLPVEKNDWILHKYSATVNALSYVDLNNIDIPAAILQGDFFNVDRPKYMNYGSIGAVIGHEVTHGFDDIGRQYDKYGNLKEWWTQSTKDSFLERAKCIVYQYGNYTADEVGLKLNGVNTQGENIADNGGVKLAYHAYIKWAEKNVQEPELPEFDYTPNQMFWISYANTWCSKYRPEALKTLINTRVHSPDKFRVIGPLSNSNEFLNDFRCKSDSKMNRLNKCSVW